MAGAVASVVLLGGGGSSTPTAHRVTGSRGTARGSSTNASHSTVTGTATGKPGTATVPVLMYHVINPPPAGAPFPGLYVRPTSSRRRCRRLKAAGWHAVTLDQLEAYWTRGVPLAAGKPIVLTFDNGYASQYENALPILKRLGWVGNENIQLTGLPPSQGGLTDAQVRGLIAAGWELDTQGISHADLITLDASELAYQVASARSDSPEALRRPGELVLLSVRPLRRDRDRGGQGGRLRRLDDGDPGLGQPARIPTASRACACSGALAPKRARRAGRDPQRPRPARVLLG